MGNLAKAYQHIADILSFETSNKELEKTLSNPQFNWNDIVIQSSKHFVLPAVYCRLKERSLLNVLPEDLNEYLKEITNINRNRNRSINKQVYTISHILDKNNIEHVFLKGSALLALNLYKDSAERMIGDIDILIPNNQISLAYDLLKKNSYYPLELSLKDKFFEHKHLPRLKSDHFISAVELHHKLFNSYKQDDFNPGTILKERQEKYNIFIPSEEALLSHNILNYQINDKGRLYNSISFRSAYDTLLLLRNKSITSYCLTNKIYRKYYRTVGLFFNDISTVTKIRSNSNNSFYLFKLKHIKFYKFWNKLIVLSSFLPNLLHRCYYFIINRQYRKAVINDRIRIYKYFKSILSSSKAFL